jgi:heat-inducible transcriptional repressor
MQEPSAITQRQLAILRDVVEEFVATGQPVGSKTLVARGGMTVSSSTVRAELADLEDRGLLTHPHTSAGRVPTDRGYRLYVDDLLGRIDPRPAAGGELELRSVRNEVESALRETSETLSQVTQLLALVSAPPLEATTVRHVEVLALQPQVVMVVLITASGEVSKRMLSFGRPVDPGLVEWARAYLNETVAGLKLGTTLLRRRFEDPSLAPSERAFLAVLRPAFTELVQDRPDRFFVGGAAMLLEDAREDELETCRRLVGMLERRASLLELVGASLDTRKPFVRMGEELQNPELTHVALVGAGYGVMHRPLGTVSLLGPVRMDYEKAIRSVRAAAHELSRFVEEVYEED